MFFAIGSRIIEIKKIHVVVFVLILVVLTASFIFFKTNSPDLESAMPIRDRSNDINIGSHEGVEFIDTPGEVNSWQTKDYKNEPIYVDDCDFNGKGHDAVLLPSGFYYCRSNENRITINVRGVDKICCVIP